MIIRCNGEELECEIAEKGVDYIELYSDENKKNIIASFKGIRDFSQYQLINGDWSFPDVSVEEQLRADVDYLLMMGGEY